MQIGADLISVIVPFYNGTKLCEAVESIVIQDYPCIEIIIIDDGSQKEIADEMKKCVSDLAEGKVESFLWITHEQNKGTVATINEAWKLSSGKFIFTLAHDDVFWNSTVLSDWVRGFKETGAEIMLGYRAIYTEDMKDLLCLSPSPLESRLMLKNASKRILRKLYRMNFMFGCAIARTAESIQKYGYIPECYRLLDDYPMVLRYYHMGAQIVLHDRIVIKYRQGGVSYSTNVTDTYQNDTRMVYDNEIIPYIRPKYYRKYLMAKQLNERTVKSEYLRMRNRHSGFVWNFMCHCRYPRFFMEKLKTLIEKPSRAKDLHRLIEFSSSPRFPFDKKQCVR